MFQRTKICSGLLIAIGSGAFSVSGVALAQDTSVQRVEIIGSSIKRVDTETDAPITTISHEEIAKSGATTVEELLRHVTSNTSSNSAVAASASGATTGGISTISLRGLGPERTLILVNGQRSAPYGDPVDSVSVDVDSIPVAAIERVEILKEGAGAIYGSDAVAGVVNFVLRKDYHGVEATGYYGQSYDGKGSVSKGSVVAGFGGDKGNATFVITAEHDMPLYGRDRSFASTNIHPEHDNFSASSGAAPANTTIPQLGLTNPLVPVIWDPTIQKKVTNADGSVVTATTGGYKATGAGNCGPLSTYSSVFGPNDCLFDTASFTSLIPDVKRVGVLFTGHYDLSDDMRLHLDASVTNKKQFVSIQPAPIGSYVGIPWTLTTANPYYPTAFVSALTHAAAGATIVGGDNNGKLQYDPSKHIDATDPTGYTPTLDLRYRPFITGNRNLTDEASNLRVSGGIDGTVAGWDYTANLLYSGSAVNESLQSGYFRINGGAASGGPGIESLLNGDVKDSSGNTLWVNPFGDNSAAVLAAAQATNFVGNAFKTRTSLQDAQLKFSRDDVVKLPGGNMGAAFGVEIRRDEFKLTAAPALASGDISGYGGNFPDFDRSRNVASFFGELDVPVIKGLDIDGAVRYDHYGSTTNPNSLAGGTATLNSISIQDNNGNTDALPGDVVARVAQEGTQNAGGFGQTTGKLGAKWTVSKQLLFRGTVSTGFRAPSLLDLYNPLQAGVSAFVNDPKRCASNPSDCGTQYNQYSGGRGDLKPERSLTYTLGTVMEPVKDVNFSLDYFHTKLRDQIAILGADYLLSHEAQYQSSIIRGPSDGVGQAGPIIAIDQRTQNITEAVVAGLDFDANATFRTAAGTFGAGVGGTWMTKWDSVNPDGSRESEIGTTSSTVTGMIPRVKLSLEGSYAMPNNFFSGSVIYNWQSHGTDVCGTLDQDDLGNCAAGITPPKVKAYGTVDLQGVFNPTKTFSGTVGLKNAFNTKPPYVNGAGGAFQSGYDPTYVDPHGRFWYVSATLRFQ
jgi:iron complex outermembrane receptor protein